MWKDNLIESCGCSFPFDKFVRAEIFLILCMAVVFLLSIGSRANAHTENLDGLLEERTTTVWIEGQQLGDMIIGSRAQVAFIFVDSKLVAAASTSPEAPQWLTWNVQHNSKAQNSGKALFIIRYKTFKPWNFNVSLISIGGYVLNDKDVITRKAFRQEGNIPSDTAGTFALMVPRKTIKKGKELELGCSGFSAVWKVPR